MHRHANRLILAACLIPLVAPEATTAAPPKEYLPERVGVREFVVGETRYKVPWYKVRADYNTIGTVAFWKKVRGLPETKAAYVGRYRQIRWCEWFKDGSHAQMRAWGVDFLADDEFLVTPGPGKVFIGRWRFEEKDRDKPMAFKDGRRYVFCLDREPVEQWRSIGKQPGCDLDTELAHVLGIIEVEPTFEFDPRASAAPFAVARESLLAFREERHGFRTEGYGQEYAVFRSEDGAFRCQTERKHAIVPASAATVQKLLYALSTAEWRKQSKPHEFEISPAVTRSILEYKDKEGKKRTVTISYDMGGWYTDRIGSDYYFTSHPHLLFEVHEDVRAAR